MIYITTQRETYISTMTVRWHGLTGVKRLTRQYTPGHAREMHDWLWHIARQLRREEQERNGLLPPAVLSRNYPECLW